MIGGADKTLAGKVAIPTSLSCHQSITEILEQEAGKVTAVKSFIAQAAEMQVMPQLCLRMTSITEGRS